MTSQELKAFMTGVSISGYGGIVMTPPGEGSDSLLYFGTTEPADKRMLWVKCDRPVEIRIVGAIKEDPPVWRDSNVSWAYLSSPGGFWGSMVSSDDGVYYGAQGHNEGYSSNSYIQLFNTTEEKTESLPYSSSSSALGGVFDGDDTNLFLIGGANYTRAMRIPKDGSRPVVARDADNMYIVPPNKIYRSGHAYYNGYIYGFGGLYWNSTSYQTSIWKFNCDPSNHSLTYTAASLPEGIDRCACVVLGKYIYIFGGCKKTDTPVNTVYRFDPETETLISIRPLPVALAGSSVGVINGKIYIIGGLLSDGTLSDKVYEYSVPTYDIKEIATLSKPSYGAGGCAHKGAIYFSGAGTGASAGMGVVSDVRRFGPEPAKKDPNTLYLIAGDSDLHLIQNGVKIAVSEALLTDSAGENFTKIDVAYYDGNKWVNI